MESMGIYSDFWFNRSVFLTGHTGFKGGWMSLWLSHMGANVYGYSLSPPTDTNFFNETRLEDKLTQSINGDILNLNNLKNIMYRSKCFFSNSKHHFLI